MKKCICKNQNIIHWPLSTPIWRKRCIIYMTDCWHYIFWLLTWENANFYETYLIHSIYFVNKHEQLPPFLTTFEALRHIKSDKCQWKYYKRVKFSLNTDQHPSSTHQGCINKVIFSYKFFTLFLFGPVCKKSVSVNLASVMTHLRKFRKMRGN